MYSLSYFCTTFKNVTRFYNAVHKLILKLRYCSGTDWKTLNYLPRFLFSACHKGHQNFIQQQVFCAFYTSSDQQLYKCDISGDLKVQLSLPLNCLSRALLFPVGLQSEVLQIQVWCYILQRSSNPAMDNIFLQVAWLPVSHSSYCCCNNIILA